MSKHTIYIVLMILITVVCLNLYPVDINAAPLKIFGYFQSQYHWRTFGESQPTLNTFLLQQLNLFFKKDLNRDWTSFINLEIVNSYSSDREWGSFNVEEAWVKYRAGKELSLKLGLQIPTFNNLNEIKNRTPLLPYIIRPPVYESSLSDIVPVDEFIPARAFIQAYGYMALGELKFDHALFAGNSPNINSDRAYQQTGIDTTSTILIGGRLGVRYRNLKTGISLTHDNTNFLAGMETLLGEKQDALKELSRTRIGADFSYSWDVLTFEGELINVLYDEETNFDFDLYFSYSTLGIYMDDKTFIYISYWYTYYNTFGVVEVIDENSGDPEIEVFDSYLKMNIPSIGLTYEINDRIKVKAQYARIKTSSRISAELEEKEKGDFFYIAISAFF
jgi:hypothetical protein